MVGPITGQLEVHGSIISGYINTMGTNLLITFTRVSDAIIPGFKLFRFINLIIIVLLLILS
jgi:hypothetical protein